MKWNRITVGDCLTSTCDDSKFSFYSELRQTLATWHMEYIRITGNRLWYPIFLRLIHPEIILKEFTLAQHKENEDQFHKRQGHGFLSQEMKSELRAQFQCRRLQEGHRLWVHWYGWNYCRTSWSDSKDSKSRNCNSTNSLFSQSFLVWKIPFKHKSLLVWFSIGCFVVDQRSGDGRFIGRIKILAIGCWKNPNLRCWMRRLLRLWTRSSQMLTSRRRSVSKNRKSRRRAGFYEEDRSPSWSTTTFEWLALIYSIALRWFILCHCSGR